MIEEPLRSRTKPNYICLTTLDSGLRRNDGQKQRAAFQRLFSLHLLFRSVRAFLELVGACIDLNLVADLDERRHRQFKTGTDLGGLHHLA